MSSDSHPGGPWIVWRIGFLILPLFLTLYWPFQKTLHAHAQNSMATVSASMRIHIQANNNLEGVLKITAVDLTEESLPVYFVLPFRIDGDIKTDQGVYASYLIVDEGISEGFTVLNVLLSSVN